MENKPSTIRRGNWALLTDWDYQRNIQFAIDQLEKAGKDYEIEKGTGRGGSIGKIRIKTQWPGIKESEE